MAVSPRNLAIGVVLFHPHWPQVCRALGGLAGDASLVIAYLNAAATPAELDVLHTAVAPRPLVVIDPSDNRGLGTAYNAIAAAARSAGAQALLLLDQDSEPPPNLLARLANIADALRAAGLRPAVVGPVIATPDGRAHKRPRARPLASPSGAAAPVETVISSGSLVDLAALAAIGAFRTDFFIDMIDTEWCFRAWAAGYSVWMADAVVMRHALGRGAIDTKCGLVLADQPAFRIFTATRNQIAMLRLGHVPAAWKIRVVISLPIRLLVRMVVRPHPNATLRATLRGVWDGLRNRLGDPRSYWRALGGGTPGGGAPLP